MIRLDEKQYRAVKKMTRNGDTGAVFEISIPVSR